MKLRICKVDNVYYPNQYTQSDWGKKWRVFSCPNKASIKFNKFEDAKLFIDLINKSIKSIKYYSKSEVVYVQK